MATEKDPGKTKQDAAAKRAIDARLAKVAGVSFEQLRSALGEALRAAYPPAEEMCGPWVEDVYDDRVIYTNAGKLFAEPYTFAGGAATLGGSPVAVARTYVPVDAAAAPAPDAAAPAPAPAPEGKTAAATVNTTAKRADDAIAALRKRATPRVA